MSARFWILLILNTGVLWADPKSPAPAPTDAKSMEQTALFADAKKRAEAGDAKAMLEHGFNHLLGFGTAIDMPTAAEWIRRAAEKGNEDAYFPYGQICQRGELRPKDLKEAIRWFRLAAAKQNPDGIIPFLVQRHAFQGVAKCYG